MLVPVAALTALAASAASVIAAPAGSPATVLARSSNHGNATVRQIDHYQAEDSWCEKYATSTPYRVVLSNDFLANTPPAFCRNVTMTATANGNSWHGVVVDGSDDYSYDDMGITQAIYDKLGADGSPVEITWNAEP